MLSKPVGQVCVCVRGREREAEREKGEKLCMCASECVRERVYVRECAWETQRARTRKKACARARECRSEISSDLRTSIAREWRYLQWIWMGFGVNLKKSHSEFEMRRFTVNLKGIHCEYQGKFTTNMKEILQWIWKKIHCKYERKFTVNIKENSKWMSRKICTGRRRLIGSPKLPIVFHKKATKYRSLLRKMAYKDKGSYESSPTCSEYPRQFTVNLRLWRKIRNEYRRKFVVNIQDNSQWIWDYEGKFTVNIKENWQ